jgi:uncharacterized protein YbbK (DUF523 family)
VSACLLDDQVRYDGGHKRNALLLEELASHLRCMPICPEIAIGLGASRETIRYAPFVITVDRVISGDPAKVLNGRVYTTVHKSRAAPRVRAPQGTDAGCANRLGRRKSLRRPMSAGEG